MKTLMIAAALIATSSSAAVTDVSLFTPAMNNLTIFADTYAGTGANSTTYGNILSGDVSTTGDTAKVYGFLVSTGAANVGANSLTTGNVTSGGVLTAGGYSNIHGTAKSSGAGSIGDHGHVGGNFISGGLASTGDTAYVDGNVLAGGKASIGANSVIGGYVGAVDTITKSASSTVHSEQQLAVSPVDPTGLTSAIAATVASMSTQVGVVQAALSTMGPGTTLAATMTVDTTLLAGVYSAASFSTTAGTTLYLDGKGKDNQFWVFNFDNIFVTGASTRIEMVNVGAGSSVIWNTGGYAALGASSTFIGTVLARDYISVGASALVSSLNNFCGGLFSATSYVSTGDSAVVGGAGCKGQSDRFRVDDKGKVYYKTDAISATPEPGTWALMIVGFGLIGTSMRRRAAAA